MTYIYIWSITIRVPSRSDYHITDQANAKVRKAERALAKAQEFLDPAELPTDLETVTDEERFLFRQMGLKMRAYLPLGKNIEVYLHYLC